MSKKKLLVMLLVATMLLSLIAATGSLASAEGAKKEVIDLVIGSGHSARQMDYMESLDDYFIPEVSRRVSEETDYEIHWTTAYGTVAKLPEMVTAVQDGLVDIGAIATAMVSAQLPFLSF